MKKQTLPLRIKITCKGLPPRCRKIREYPNTVTHQFEIKTLEELPTPDFSINKDSIRFPNGKDFYLIEDELYTKTESTLKTILLYLESPKEYEVPEEISFLSSDEIERVANVCEILDNYILLPNGTLLEKTVEPGYSLSHSFPYNYIHIDEFPNWGNTQTYRIDQWEEIKEQYSQEKRQIPPITIHKPNALRAPKNPGSEIKIDPKGESPESIFEKLRTIVAFNQEFQEPSNIQEFYPPLWKEGLWKPLIANTNKEEIRVILAEVNPANNSPMLHGKIQTIFFLQEQFTFSKHWKSKISTLRDFCKSASPEKTEEEWKFHPKPEKQDPNEIKKQAYHKMALEIIHKKETKPAYLYPETKDPQEEMELPFR